MSNKKRSPKHTQKNVAVPMVAVPVPKPPVLNGDVFVTFLDEARSIGNEVAARRALQKEVGEFLAEKGLVEAFEAWRTARAPKA